MLKAEAEPFICKDKIVISPQGPQISQQIEQKVGRNGFERRVLGRPPVIAGVADRKEDELAVNGAPCKGGLKHARVLQVTPCDSPFSCWAPG
eukprot:scaffold42728_cov27-Tisochrysis_lutea.AAC.5